MKHFLPALLLLILSNVSVFSQNLHNSEKKESFIDHITINPLRPLLDEAIFHIENYDNKFIRGYMIGFIHPNKFLSDYLIDKYTFGQLQYENWGIGAGTKLDIFKSKHFNLNCLLRYAWGNNITVQRELTWDHEWTTDVNVDQREFSVNMHLEVFNNLYTIKTVHQVYFGLGAKLFNRNTIYNDSPEDPAQNEIHFRRLDFEKGWFILPTIHLGSRIGKRI